MALGRSAIAEARGNVRHIRQNVADVEESSRQIRALFEDENFQKFVRESNYGASINEALNQLIKFTGSDLSGMIGGLCSSTESFLNHQEALNNRTL